mmetsp:Transcript_32311/g.91610  ORF Transcript_32311/g.91610 Transcript_32311/m.91610 type:complete len:355 (+) Transcript_32311:651-1715(+)
MLPCTSMLSTPPSLFSSTCSFSSMMMKTGSEETGALTAAGAELLDMPRSMSTDSPSACREARMLFFFLLPPSCMPLDGPRSLLGKLGRVGSGCMKEGPMSMSEPMPLAPGLAMLLEIPDEIELAKDEREPLPSMRLRSTLVFSISMALRFMTSLVSLILLWMIILCSFSSWLSMSVFCLTCVAVMFSFMPAEMTSSKAKIRSKACRTMVSSSTDSTYIGTTLESSRSVSRSSRMLLCLFVTSNRYSPSRGWYTYLTLLVSTKVCCLPVPTSLGNAASSPSMRIRLMSMNWRDTRALPDLVTTEAARTTIVTGSGRKSRGSEPPLFSPAAVARDLRSWPQGQQALAKRESPIVAG